MRPIFLERRASGLFLRPICAPGISIDMRQRVKNKDSEVSWPARGARSDPEVSTAVIVLENDFRYQEEHYRSPSAIAGSA
jgi:hypothetical protein